MNSIRTKIIVLIVLSLGTVGGLFIFHSVAVNRETRRTHIENVTHSLLYESERVNKTIRGLEQNAIDLALIGKTVYHAKHPQNDSHPRKVVRENFEKNPETVGGGIWFERFSLYPDKERYCIYVCRDESGEVKFQPDFDSKPYDYPTQSWYTQLKKQQLAGNRTGWSKPYFDDLGTRALMTTVGAAIYDDGGRFIGMSTLDWKMQTMINQLCALKPTPHSFVTLVAPYFEQVIADTRRKDTTEENSSLNESMHSLKWYAKIPQLSRNQIAVSSFVFEGVSYLSFGRKLDNGMQILVQVPETELNGFIEFRNTLVLLGGIFLTVLILAISLWYLTTRINRPLKQLMASVGRIGKGELDTKLEIRGNDEIAMLGTTFNRMTADLKTHIEHLKEMTAAKEKIESELKVAQEIQMGILPKILPPFPKCDFFELDAFLSPAREVGGDLYDFFLLSPTKVCIVIGDVSGKGVPASLFMAVTQTLHRGFAHEVEIEPRHLVEKMNQALCNNNNAGLFVTYVFAILDLESGIMTYCNAGHNPFLLLKSDGSVTDPTRRHGIPLGVLPDRSYQQSELPLEIGDTLFFYTDGVTEAKNGADEFFGMERLTGLLHRAAAEHLSPRRIDALVQAELAAFVGAEEQFDDVTVITIRIIARSEK